MVLAELKAQERGPGAARHGEGGAHDLGDGIDLGPGRDQQVHHVQMAQGRRDNEGSLAVLRGEVVSIACALLRTGCPA